MSALEIQQTGQTEENESRPNNGQNHTAKSRKAKCPSFPSPSGIVAHYITLVLLILLIWLLLYGLLGSPALPGGGIFVLLVLAAASYIGGRIVNLLKLPPLLGMLLAGLALKNISFVSNAIGMEQLNDRVASVLRQIALVVILIRAGLNLDPHLVWKLKGIVLRLSVIPCILEASCVGIVAHFLLNFPWVWAFLLGFVLSAVSPAVVVPSLLGLGEQGYGVSKGIPTLGIAASSVNQIIAICIFGVLLGAAFAQGSTAMIIANGPIQLIVGLVYGIVLGAIAWYLPHWKANNVSFYRWLVVFMGGLAAVLAGSRIEYSGAGALGCLVLAFVAAFRWRTENDGTGHIPIVAGFAIAWDIFQPLLFVLIGTKVDFKILSADLVWKGLICILAGLVGCCVSCFFMSLGQGMNLKERLFLSIAWIPKATVQAAIGPLALDTAIKLNAGEEDITRGTEVLTIAVLTILVTAPIGAVAIAMSGPRLLRKEENQTPKPVQELQSVEDGNPERVPSEDT